MTEDEGEDAAADVATPSLAARLHVTLGHPPRRFVPGDPAPAGIQWCLAPEAGPTADLGPDGLARHGLIPTLDLPRRMWAGVTIETRRPIRVGDPVTRRSHTAPPLRKTGRTGPLAFVAITHEYRVGDAVALVETQHIAYRAAPGPADKAPDLPPAAAPGGSLLREVALDPSALFRFSALTFNAHRIHVDRDFARETEGYDDILVHGTLTAALMLDAAFAARPPPPTWRTTIRARAPVPCGPLEIRARDEAAGRSLEAYRGETLVMTALLGD